MSRPSLIPCTSSSCESVGARRSAAIALAFFSIHILCVCVCSLGTRTSAANRDLDEDGGNAGIEKLHGRVDRAATIALTTIVVQ